MRALFTWANSGNNIKIADSWGDYVSFLYVWLRTERDNRELTMKVSQDVRLLRKVQMTENGVRVFVRARLVLLPLVPL